MDNHMSFAAAFHMLLPLFSYTGLVESAALPLLLIRYGEMIVQAHHNMLNKKKAKGGNIIGTTEEAKTGLRTNCRVPPRMGMDMHRKVN